jgi:hypothetical protein
LPLGVGLSSSLAIRHGVPVCVVRKTLDLG